MSIDFKSSHAEIAETRREENLGVSTHVSFSAPPRSPREIFLPLAHLLNGFLNHLSRAMF
jgi:hypothetical protein